jgi:hypothetical protein
MDRQYRSEMVFIIGRVFANPRGRTPAGYRNVQRTVNFPMNACNSSSQNADCKTHFANFGKPTIRLSPVLGAVLGRLEWVAVKQQWLSSRRTLKSMRKTRGFGSRYSSSAAQSVTRRKRLRICIFSPRWVCVQPMWFPFMPWPRSVLCRYRFEKPRLLEMWPTRLMLRGHWSWSECPAKSAL